MRASTRISHLALAQQQPADECGSGRVLLLLGLVSAVSLTAGCRGETGEAGQRSWATVRTSGGQPAALAALMMPYAAIRAGLGPHRVKVYARLEREAGTYGNTVVEQSVEISVDGNGGFVARKNTDRQYGSEVIWTGRKLYTKSRYGKFLQRDPTDPAEPKRIAERMYGILSAYLRLLEPFVEVEASSRGMRSGRRAERVLLGRAEEAYGEPEVAGTAQAWRKTVRVESLGGAAWLDEESGAALKVSLDARWTYALPESTPPESGVPANTDTKARGTMRLRLTQLIDAIGAVTPVRAPSRRRTVADDRRLRLERERQLVVGERRMPKKLKSEDEPEGARVAQ